MKKNWGMKYVLLSLMMMGMIGAFLCGCTIKDGTEKKLRDVEFTVLSEEEVPPEFLEFIYGKQSEAFKLTYSTDEYLYIAAGYGQQPTGGYSIAVNDLYMTENAMVIDTELIGPSASENNLVGVSYPFIVIKTEKNDMTVIFQ